MTVSSDIKVILLAKLMLHRMKPCVLYLYFDTLEVYKVGHYNSPDAMRPECVHHGFCSIFHNASSNFIHWSMILWLHSHTLQCLWCYWHELPSICWDSEVVTSTVLPIGIEGKFNGFLWTLSICWDSEVVTSTVLPVDNYCQHTNLGPYKKKSLFHHFGGYNGKLSWMLFMNPAR